MFDKGARQVKNLILINCFDDKVSTPIDLDRLDGILRIDIQVISGDEIVTVIYKDGSKEVRDSGRFRTLDFNDGEYCIYQAGLNNDIDKWLKRKDSYDYLYKLKEQENETSKR